MSPPEFDSGAGTATCSWPVADSLELGALPTAVGCARLHAKHVLLEWGLQAVVGDAEVLVSELVTNAVQASRVLEERPPVTLRLLADHERLVVEVWDRSPAEPTLGEADASSEQGWGLGIVATLSHRWGFKRADYGLKVVWCELDLSLSSRLR